MKTATSEDINVCQEFLINNEYAVLATVSKAGEPSAAVVTYIMDSDWQIYFFTRRQTTKDRNLSLNNRISMVVGAGPSPVSAQVFGFATTLSKEETDRWMDEFLTRRDGFYMTFLKLEGYDFVAYKITPTEINWLKINDDDEKEDIVKIKL